MRRVLRALVILIGVAGGGVLFVVFALCASLPKVSGTVGVAGLSGPITIIRDHAGIPHVFAQTPADAARGLGFVQGQDRRLQMELARRLGLVRMAEILGGRRPPCAADRAGGCARLEHAGDGRAERWSSHYADLAEPWLRGYYRPMLWTRADVEADAESTLILEPAP